jgi:hypothetical protein
MQANKRNLRCHVTLLGKLHTYLYNAVYYFSM